MTTQELIDAAKAVLEAKALSGVRALVAGWNGEDKPEGQRYGRHPNKLGATLPKTTCGAVYELDEAMQRLRTAISACEGEKAGEVPTRGRPDWWLDDIKAFPETWETVESTPRKITILGDFAIDPDCYVAELEGEAGKVWVIKHSGSVLRKSSRKKLLARPIDLAPKE